MCISSNTNADTQQPEDNLVSRIPMEHLTAVEILYAVSWQAADYMEEKGDPDGLSLATALRGSAAIVRKTMPKEV